ncbi:hypothetical protein AJ88_46990 [Mesorhizobium amorphae CCBAU 01583]|nr:hypothetical protein AJ88_46990 [Mesorhizobium amorphae CCBAU 01583]
MVFLFQQHSAPHQSNEEVEFISDLRKTRTADQTVFVIMLAALFGLLAAMLRQDPQINEAV